jgi:hypothetical protein
MSKRALARDVNESKLLRAAHMHGCSHHAASTTKRLRKRFKIMQDAAHDAMLVPNLLHRVVIKMPLHSARICAAGGSLDELIVMMRPHFGGAG